MALALGMLGACSAPTPRERLAERGVVFTVEAFVTSVTQGQTDVVDLFLDAGLDVNATDDAGNTALMHAVGAGQSRVATLLLGRGADPDVRTPTSGATALGLAAARGDTGIVKLLIAKGADTEARESSFGMTPLAVAAFKGHVDTVRALLAAGADAAATDRDGLTPLAIANAADDAAVAALLAGAQPRHQHGGTGLFRRTAAFAPPAGWVLADPFTDQTPFFSSSSLLRAIGGPDGTRRALLRAPNEIGAQAFIIRGPRAGWLPLLRAELVELGTHPLVTQRPLETIETADGLRVVVSVSRMRPGLIAGADTTWVLAALTFGDEILIVDAGGPSETFRPETVLDSVASLDLGRDLGIHFGRAPSAGLGPALHAEAVRLGAFGRERVRRGGDRRRSPRHRGGRGR